MRVAKSCIGLLERERVDLIIVKVSVDGVYIKMTDKMLTVLNTPKRGSAIDNR